MPLLPLPIAKRRASAPRWPWVRAVLGVAIRPWLWATAALQARRMAQLGWWRRPPFLPTPDRAYLQFRLETQYGHDGAPAPRDLVTYLDWCRSERRRTG